MPDAPAPGCDFSRITMSAPEPWPCAASSLPRWYAVERPCRPAPTTRYFVRAGSTMNSLLPYRQCCFRDRHSVACERATRQRRASGSLAALERVHLAAPRDLAGAVGGEGALLDGDCDRLLDQRGPALGRQDADHAVGAEESREALVIARLLMPGAGLEELAVPRVCEVHRPVVRARGQVIGIRHVQEVDDGVVPGAFPGRRIPACDHDAART